MAIFVVKSIVIQINGDGYRSIICSVTVQQLLIHQYISVILLAVDKLALTLVQNKKYLIEQ